MPARHRAASASRPARRDALIVALVFALTIPLLFASVALAAGGDTIFSRQFSTSTKGDAYLDVARGVGGAYYCAGVTRATEESSVLLLVKYKADGARMWARTWRSPSVRGAAAARVAVADNGDVIVAGSIGVAPPASAKGRDVVVLSYTSEGSRKWVVKFDGAAGKDDYAADLALDGSGGAYVAGVSRGATSGQDYLVLEVTPGGAVRWSWTYDGHGGRDLAAGVAVDGNGNCYVSGSSQGRGGTTAAATARLDRRGGRVWLKRLQFGDERQSDASALVYRRIRGDRRLFLTGSAVGPSSTRRDLLIAEIDAATGASLHHAAVDGGGADDGGASLAVDATGNAYAAGWTTDATSHVVHAFLARMSADGTVPWTDALWLPEGDNEAYYQTVDLDAAGNPVCGGYAVRPDYGPEGIVESYWPTGGRRWVNLSSGSASAADICRAVLADESGVWAVGQVTRSTTGIDAQLKKIEP